MHFGTGPVNMDAVVDLDPYILDEHLQEIDVCSKVSKSIFFIVSIGRQRQKLAARNIIDKQTTTENICVVFYIANTGAHRTDIG